MPLELGNQADWHWLVRILLTDGVTVHRFADDDLAMGDEGQFYGYLSDSQSTVLDRRLGPPEESVEIFSDMELDFDDPEAVIWDLTGEENWADATVEVYLGQGRVFADYGTPIHIGRVQFPGMKRRNVRRTTIVVRDKRRSDSRPLPQKVYSSTPLDAMDSLQAEAVSATTITVSDAGQFSVGDLLRIGTNLGADDKGFLVQGVDGDDLQLDQAVTAAEDTEVAFLHFPNLEDKSEGKSIPIRYGDWSATAGAGEQLPVVCIDTVVNRFHVMDRSMLAGSLSAANNGKVTHLSPDEEADVTADIVEIDYERSMFEFNATPYNQSTDSVYVNCKGRTDDGTSGGGLITLLVRIWEDFLKSWMFQTDAGIDQDALTQWEADVPYLARLSIDTPQSSDDVIAALMYDAFSDQDFRAGKYFPMRRTLDIDPDAPAFTADDVIDDGTDSDPQPRFEIVTDEQLFLNRADYFFRFNPRSGRFEGQGQRNDEGSQVALGLVRSRELEFLTLYDASNALHRAAIEVLAFGQDTEVIRVGLLQRATQLGLGGNLFLTFDVLVDQQLTVREMGLDLPGISNDLLAWNITTLGIGHWTDGTAPDWPSSSTSQRSFQGFHTNALGEAFPGDLASRSSKWT